MRRLARALSRPQYLFNPWQLLRRVRYMAGRAPAMARLAWGMDIRVFEQCHTGVDIRNLGVYDLVVPEALVRLLEEGELGVDVGANVGQNTCALACAAGPRGRVVSFEPHPDLIGVLVENVARWTAFDVAPIMVVPLALSDSPGTVSLHESDEFAVNRGCASMARPAHVVRSHAIATTTIDEVFPVEHVGVMKLDVEGYELHVLEGAACALRTGRIRDIVFEELQTPPTPAIRHLEEAGYEVLALFTRMTGPHMVPWRDARRDGSSGVFTFNYVATREPGRARARLAPWGWRCLRMRPVGRR